MGYEGLEHERYFLAWDTRDFTLVAVRPDQLENKRYILCSLMPETLRSAGFKVSVINQIIQAPMSEVALECCLEREKIMEENGVRLKPKDFNPNTVIKIKQ